MSKILLINSPNRQSEPPRHYPYGIGIVTRLLKREGHEIITFDGNFNDLNRLEQVVTSERFDYAGISGLVTTFLYQERVSELIKRLSPSTTVVSGGGLASAVDSELLEIMPAIDALVIGEGELSVPAFFKNGSRDTKGIAYREGSRIIRNESAPLLERLDESPAPDLESWEIEKYFANGSFPLSPNVSSAQRRGNILTSRGCPFKCDFCFNSLGRRKVRYRSTDNVLAEIENLVDEYGVDFISFMDEEFLANRNRVMQVAEGILSKGWNFKWGIAARSTSISSEVLRTIKKAGCDFIYFGFDSGSESTLKRMDKKMTADDHFDAFRLSVEAGIYPVPNIIIGYDNETLDNIAEDYAFFSRLIEYGRTLTSQEKREVFERGFNNFGAIYFATPYPGSQLYARNRDRLPPLVEVLRRVSFKDAYELTVNVSQIPDEVLIAEKLKMERYVREFKL